MAINSVSGEAGVCPGSTQRSHEQLVVCTAVSAYSFTRGPPDDWSSRTVRRTFCNGFREDTADWRVSGISTSMGTCSTGYSSMESCHTSGPSAIVGSSSVAATSEIEACLRGREGPASAFRESFLRFDTLTVDDGGGVGLALSEGTTLLVRDFVDVPDAVREMGGDCTCPRDILFKAGRVDSTTDEPFSTSSGSSEGSRTFREDLRERLLDERECRTTVVGEGPWVRRVDRAPAGTISTSGEDSNSCESVVGRFRLRGEDAGMEGGGDEGGACGGFESGGGFPFGFLAPGRQRHV